MNNEIIEETIAETFCNFLELKDFMSEIIDYNIKYTKYNFSIFYDKTVKKYIHKIGNEYIKIDKIFIKCLNNSFNIQLYDTKIFNILTKYIVYFSISQEDINYLRNKIIQLVNHKNREKEKEKEKKKEKENNKASSSFEKQINYYMYISYMYYNKKYILCIENPHLEKRKKQDNFFNLINTEYEYEFVAPKYNYCATNLIKMYEGPYKDFNSDFSNLSPRMILNTPLSIHSNSGFFDKKIVKLLVKNVEKIERFELDLDLPIIEEIQKQKYSIEL